MAVRELRRAHARRVIPVEQTVSGWGKGNCVAACVASILELSIEEVPNFVGDYGDDWWSAYGDWLRERGFSAVEVKLDREGINWFGTGTVGYFIATVPSLNVTDPETGEPAWHAVVMRGATLAHDPAIGKKRESVDWEEVKLIKFLVPNNPVEHSDWLRLQKAKKQ